MIPAEVAELTKPLTPEALEPLFKAILEYADAKRAHDDYWLNEGGVKREWYELFTRYRLRQAEQWFLDFADGIRAVGKVAL